MTPPAGAAIPAPKGYHVQEPITCKGRLHHFSRFLECLTATFCGKWLRALCAALQARRAFAKNSRQNVIRFSTLNTRESEQRIFGKRVYLKPANVEITYCRIKIFSPSSNAGHS
jgi:hypothetical protein